MNFTQQLLAKGTAVLAQSGPQSERFTLDGETVLANCNRTPESSDPEGVKGVSTQEGSVIEWPLGTATIPSRGSLPVDSFGYIHRVKSVKHIGHALRLECEVTR
jgi:hypothetical protein